MYFIWDIKGNSTETRFIIMVPIKRNNFINSCTNHKVILEIKHKQTNKTRETNTTKNITCKIASSKTHKNNNEFILTIEVL